MKDVHILAHRGAPLHRPENTIESFRYAFEHLGAKWAELDVHPTREGTPVVIHDPRLRRTTNLTGLVRQTPLKELQKGDAAFFFSPEKNEDYPFRNQSITIPTLEEVLTIFPEQGFFVEIKPKEVDFTQEVLKVVKEANAWDRFFVGSFHHSVSQFVTKYYPDARCICSRWEILQLRLSFMGQRELSGKWEGRICSIPPRRWHQALDTKEWIDFLHDHGMLVYYWDVHTSEHANALIQKGADGLILDDPSMIKHP